MAGPVVLTLLLLLGELSADMGVTLQGRKGLRPSLVGAAMGIAASPSLGGEGGELF